MQGNQLELCREKVGEATVAYSVAGNGPALVLLHGLSGSARWWGKNVAALAAHFRVYVVDLIGFGRSRGQRFVLEEAPAILAGWAEQVGVDHFHLMGHSMGGWVAVELAVQHPEWINRLVLVDAAAAPLGRSWWNSALRLAPSLVYMPLDFLPVLVGDALRAGPLTLLRASRDLHRIDNQADLEKLAARTLIVWGEHDQLLPVAYGRNLQQALPGAEFVVLSGAGHNAMWDRAERFNRLALAFLQGDDKRITPEG